MIFNLFLAGLSMIFFIDNQNYNAPHDAKVIALTCSALPLDGHQFKPDTLADPINISRVKALDFLTTTAGVIPEAEAAKFCPVDTVGFLGFYHLINKQTLKQLGMLTVSCGDKPENWRYDTKNERFVAIELNGNAIKVWDRELIGMTKELLLKFIGPRFHYLKGQTMFVDFGDYEGVFWLKGKVVYKLEIKKNCKGPKGQN